jgi:O-antigen ligase
MVQFGLLNFFQIVPGLPEGLSATPWRPLDDIYRTDGVLRPAGLSYEPATYAIALAVALVLLLLLLTLGEGQRYRRLGLVSGLILVGASLLTLSLTGWAVLLPALLLGALHKRFRRLTLPGLVVAAVVVIIVVYAGFAPVVTDRLSDVVAGRDESANVRVLAALALLVHPTHDLAYFFTGYGWGQSAEFVQLMDTVYLSGFGIYETNIHNIFTVVRVTQGWVGLALHLLLLLAVLRPGVRHNRMLYLPLFVTIITLHFASGFYLDPVFWALLALIAVLRDSDAAEGNRADSR